MDRQKRCSHVQRTPKYNKLQGQVKNNLQTRLLPVVYLLATHRAMLCVRVLL